MKKLKVLPALLAAMAIAYIGSAFAPASVSASTSTAAVTHGFFAQDRGVRPYFIHITSADILHNDPCGPGDQLGNPAVHCPLFAVVPKNL